MVINQATLFLIFILNGFLVGVLFDIFRIIRKTFKTKDIVTYIQDILFWILTGFLIIYFVFNFSEGEIRGYMFIAIVLGIGMYILTCSKIITIISVYILNKIIRACEIITIPFKYIIKQMFLLFKQCAKKVKNIKFSKKMPKII